MTSDEIRQSFLDFFAAKGHAIVPSSPLLPSAPNLLFTNAGMNQFVPYFLGERPAPYPRAADTQKCIRAGGKHNDLEDVGFDTYHHTFFEMLGNWSFGDYFKKEAISWGWELLTKVWGFPKERLYATVYQPGEGDPADFDQEAWDYWAAIFRAEGMDPAVHIRTGGKADNFWMMGDTGPCGPCSEIHMDLTPAGDTGGALVNADSGRCIEIWNLVFIQFNAEPGGDFKPLANKHVDTGMGFERVAGIMASTKGFTDYTAEPSNYDSDLFGDIFAQLTEMSGHPYGATLAADRDKMSDAEMKDCAFRILADHARTLSCSIADGIIPGNDGRNYVLKRILRRAVHWANRLGLEKGSFSQLVEPVVAKLGGVFPELAEQRDIVRRVIASEEASFERNIDRGQRLFDKIAEECGGTISGEDAFTLYDTYGFPLDLTELIARERGLKVDTAGFDVEMEKQKALARGAQKKSVITVSEGDEDTGAATEFVGYERGALTQFETTITDLVTVDGQSYLALEKTPFYAEMGGQLGDTGKLDAPGFYLDVTNTIKDGAGRVLHAVDLGGSPDLIGQPATVSVDVDRRRAIERHHSATHVLHWALREVLGTHVRQAGSLVTDDRLRFDFAHFEAPSKEQLARIETLANGRILENAGINWYETAFDEKPENCIAFFGEKYGNIVRVVDIGGWSVELCGGTHVLATGEIGLLKIVHEGGIAAGTRRIEAVVGAAAFDLFSQNYNDMLGIANRLSCKPAELDSRLDKLLNQVTSLERELKQRKREAAAGQADDLAANAKKVGDLSIVAQVVEVSNPNEMRTAAVEIAKKIGEGVVVVGGKFGPKVTVLALCTPAAVKAGYQAGAIVRELTAQLGGKGGGKPDFAMGGGQEPDKLEGVLEGFLAG